MRSTRLRPGSAAPVGSGGEDVLKEKYPTFGSVEIRERRILVMFALSKMVSAVLKRAAFVAI